ncbi:MAG: polymer-forming cytoskeletal protein [Chloroflexi bacterium]|nr:polymer-forming cytoskeletal protein [Chloroflexota bacterium]
MGFFRNPFRREGDDDALPQPVERPRRPALAGPEPNATSPPAAAAHPAPSEPASPSPNPSVIGPSAQVQGLWRGKGTLRVEGVFRGAIVLDGTLVIARGGQVHAEEPLRARRIVVEGVLRGDLLAETLEIRRTGRVWGDVIVQAFITHEGAFLRGQVRMEDRVDLGFEEPESAAASDEADETPTEDETPEAGTQASGANR